MDSNTKPRQPDIDGFVNSAGAVEGLQFYKDQRRGHAWFVELVYENIDAYRSGQVAMQMNLRLSGLVLK
jgi:multiple sugar transport system substrate-binding protein